MEISTGHCSGSNGIGWVAGNRRRRLLQHQEGTPARGMADGHHPATDAKENCTALRTRLSKKRNNVGIRHDCPYGGRHKNKGI